MFEDIKANIVLLEGMDSIPVEVLLDSMRRLFRGAKIADVPVASIEDYADGLVNLFACIKPSYRQVADRLKRLDDDYLQEVIASSIKIEEDLAALRPTLEKLKAEREKNAGLEQTYRETQEQLAQLQALADRVKDISAKDIDRERTEAESALTAIRNAWESVRLREDLPFCVGSLEEFRDIDPEIRSFSDMAQWFDKTGTGIEKALAVYTQMYQKLLGILNQTARWGGD